MVDLYVSTERSRAISISQADHPAHDARPGTHLNILKRPSLSTLNLSLSLPALPILHNVPNKAHRVLFTDPRRKDHHDADLAPEQVGRMARSGGGERRAGYIGKVVCFLLARGR